MTGQEFTKNEAIAALSVTCVALWLQSWRDRRNMRQVHNAAMNLVDVAAVHIDATNWLMEQLNEGREWYEYASEWNERVTFIDQVNHFYYED